MLSSFKMLRPTCRLGSPRPGASMRITRAPSRASRCVKKGRVVACSSERMVMLDNNLWLLITYHQACCHSCESGNPAACWPNLSIVALDARYTCGKARSAYRKHAGMTADKHSLLCVRYSLIEAEIAS